MANAFTFSIFLLTVCNSSQITGYIKLTLKLFAVCSTLRGTSERDQQFERIMNYFKEKSGDLKVTS